MLVYDEEIASFIFQEIPELSHFWHISDLNSLSDRFCYPTLSASAFNLTAFLAGMLQH